MLGPQELRVLGRSRQSRISELSELFIDVPEATRDRSVVELCAIAGEFSRVFRDQARSPVGIRADDREAEEVRIGCGRDVRAVSQLRSGHVEARGLGRSAEDVVDACKPCLGDREALGIFAKRARIGSRERNGAIAVHQEHLGGGLVERLRRQRARHRNAAHEREREHDRAPSPPHNLQIVAH